MFLIPVSQSSERALYLGSEISSFEQDKQNLNLAELGRYEGSRSKRLRAFSFFRMLLVQSKKRSARVESRGRSKFGCDARKSDIGWRMKLTSSSADFIVAFGFLDENIFVFIFRIPFGFEFVLNLLFGNPVALVVV